MNKQTTEEEFIMNCLSKFKQFNIYDQFKELKSLAKSKPTGFITLLKSNFDIKTFIPASFTQKYWSNLGKNREYQLHSVLSALLIMHIFNIPTTTLLCLFLTFSEEMREFCCFDGSIPDDSFFSRFKTDFEKEILELFNSMSLHTIELCVAINEMLPDDHPEKNLNQNLIYDTSGLKPRVKENNPKFITTEIRRHKTYAKSQGFKNYNPYAAAYTNLPKHAECNSAIRLDYVNGHYGYFYKFGMLTNGWGIPLHIHFFDKDFYDEHCKEFDTPEDQKYTYDNASLKPVLSPFIQLLDTYSDFKFKNFLGDSEFDSYDNFGFLKSFNFEKVFIPLNSRNSKNNIVNGLEYDAQGIPLCPLTKKPFKAEGSCKGKNRSMRFKFVCPLSAFDENNKRYHTCNNPCTPSKSGRMTYVYPDKDFRLYPGVQRNSTEWNTVYPTRNSIEREFSCLKSNTCIATPLTTNTRTMRVDLYLAAIAKLVNVILAYSLNNVNYIRTIRPLFKLVA